LEPKTFAVRHIKSAVRHYGLAVRCFGFAVQRNELAARPYWLAVRPYSLAVWPYWSFFESYSTDLEDQKLETQLFIITKFHIMKGKYNCPQSVFIVLVDTVLNSLGQHLAAVTAEIPKYDQTWIDDLRTMLVAAIALPTEEEAQAVSSLIRGDLVTQNLVCCGLWQTLALRI